VCQQAWYDYMEITSPSSPCPPSPRLATASITTYMPEWVRVLWPWEKWTDSHVFRRWNACRYMRLTSAWTVRHVSLIFGMKELIRRRAVLGEYEHCRSKTTGPLEKPQNKKVAILITTLNSLTRSYHSSAGQSPASIPGQVTWDLWWTKWHWGMFLRELCFPLPILILPTAPHSSSIARGWYNGLNTGRRNKWTQSHPTKNNKKILTPWKLVLFKKLPVAQLLNNFPTFYGPRKFNTV
jgi:hypothetical protein